MSELKASELPGMKVGRHHLGMHAVFSTHGIAQPFEVGGPDEEDEARCGDRAAAAALRYAGLVAAVYFGQPLAPWLDLGTCITAADGVVGRVTACNWDVRHPDLGRVNGVYVEWDDGKKGPGLNEFGYGEVAKFLKSGAWKIP